MAWQQASADGGPLQPLTWVTLHHPDRYAALDYRISQCLRERADHERLRARLAQVEAEIERITNDLADREAGTARELVEGAVDLAAGGVSRILGHPSGAPPSSRRRRRAARVRLRRELAEATAERAAVRTDLQRTSRAYRDLMAAVSEKAERVIADEREGWREVREALHVSLPEAKHRYEQVEKTRDRLREARLAAHRTHDVVRLWHLGADHGAAADAARAEARRLGDAVEALRRALTGLGPDAPGLGALPDLDIPPYGTATELQRRSEETLRVVGRISRGLDALGRLDAVATARIRAIADAEDALVHRMRRPY